MLHTNKPIVAFSFQSNDLFRFFVRCWERDTYKEYGTWAIMENELYDFLYRD